MDRHALLTNRLQCLHLIDCQTFSKHPTILHSDICPGHLPSALFTSLHRPCFCHCRLPSLLSHPHISCPSTAADTSKPGANERSQAALAPQIESQVCKFPYSLDTPCNDDTRSNLDVRSQPHACVRVYVIIKNIACHLCHRVSK